MLRQARSWAELLGQRRTQPAPCHGSASSPPLHQDLLLKLRWGERATGSAEQRLAPAPDNAV